MYSQNFDASEFDYLNAGNFSETENQTQTKTPEITNIERFWNLTGNWGEFGTYFGVGLSASLVVRAVPALIPAAVILIPAASLGLLVHTLTADGSAKLRSQLILIAVGTALLSANWDAWLAWIIANSQLLLFTAALLIIFGCFVVTQVWSKLHNVNK
jgi:ABC-type multidrug transport system permease subunit